MSKRINEITVSQAAAVIVWLWAAPFLDELDPFGFASAAAALLKVFVFYMVGVCLAAWLPWRNKRLLSSPALLVSCILLATGYFIPYRSVPTGYLFLLPLFRAVGALILGFALKIKDASIRPKSFTRGVLSLILLYTLYNLVLDAFRFTPVDMKFIWIAHNILYVLLRVFIAIYLWSLLRMDEVRRVFERLPKLTLFVAGLLWGSFIVIPADRYNDGIDMIIMMLAAPVLAYVYTVLIRLAVRIAVNLMRCIRSKKMIWKGILKWW